MAKKRSNKKFYLIIASIIVVLVGGGFIAKSAGWIGKTKAKEVQFAKVGYASIVEKVSASGKIQPIDEVKVSPEVPGEIVELLIEDGDSVKVGQLLARIRPDNLRSALDRTTANLNNQKANLSQSKARLDQVKAQYERARQDYERNAGLYEQKVISKQEYDAFRAAFDAAKADVEASEQNIKAAQFLVQSAEASVVDARETLRLTEIYAPMTGLVTRLNVKKGERVVGTQQMAGTEMFRIADLNQMEVRVNVNENDIIRISIGDTAIIDVDSYSFSGRKFKGLVSAIANSANEGVATNDVVTEFEVRIRILNESFADLLKEKKTSPFRPGMTATVDIITDAKEKVLSVPLAAVTTRKPEDTKGPGEKGGAPTTGSPASTSSSGTAPKQDVKEVVFVKEDNKVKMVEVKTGISDFDNIEVLSGLQEGQEVVRGPFLMVSRQLKDGDEVQDMQAKKKPEGKE